MIKFDVHDLVKKASQAQNEKPFSERVSELLTLFHLTIRWAIGTYILVLYVLLAYILVVVAYNVAELITHFLKSPF